MRIARLFLLVLALALLALGAPVRVHAASPPAPYEIIVHPGNPAGVLDRRFCEDAFLKKVTAWPDGAAIRPVDLPPESPVRRSFTEYVLRRSVSAVKTYWQQRIFSGRDVPPPELDDEDQVVTYVLKHEGAVGYVSTSANLRGAKVILLQ
ncbi:MAG TPA: hypothetical protein VKU41_31685 [Polyangiaceae bacterium]|nr:hypothetical protein [Polyangiaceae bacterium]